MWNPTPLAIRQQATQAGLARVNAALDRWAELEARAELPSDVLALLPPLTPPTLSCAALWALHGVPVDVLADQELEADRLLD